VNFVAIGPCCKFHASNENDVAASTATVRVLVTVFFEVAMKLAVLVLRVALRK
jgi:hypothetical protein